MARYTFTCEHFDYDLYRGDEIGVASKHSTEFRADTLETMLENFELFLRGAGFHFDGVVDIVKPDDERDAEEDLRAIDEFVAEQRGHRVFSSMVDDLLKSNETVTLSGASDSDGQYNINFDNMAGAQGTFTINDEIDLTSINLSLNETDDLSVFPFEIKKENETCELCKLPVHVMKMHQCFDPKCPCGAYRKQFHSEK